MGDGKLHSKPKRIISLAAISSFFLKWSAVIGIWGAVMLASVVIYFAYDLPPVDGDV